MIIADDFRWIVLVRVGLDKCIYWAMLMNCFFIFSGKEIF
jgi:hypothetical protein